MTQDDVAAALQGEIPLDPARSAVKEKVDRDHGRPLA